MHGIVENHGKQSFSLIGRAKERISPNITPLLKAILGDQKVGKRRKPMIFAIPP
jgi:hypothetical protein